MALRHVSLMRKRVECDHTAEGEGAAGCDHRVLGDCLLLLTDDGGVLRRSIRMCTERPRRVPL